MANHTIFLQCENQKYQAKLTALLENEGYLVLDRHKGPDVGFDLALCAGGHARFELSNSTPIILIDADPSEEMPTKSIVSLPAHAGKDTLLQTIKTQLELQQLRTQLKEEVEARMELEEMLAWHLTQTEMLDGAVLDFELTETMPVAILITQVQDGQIVFANKRSEALLGLPRYELQGRSILDFYADPAKRNELLQVLYEQGMVESEEGQLRNANGEIRWVVISVSPYEIGEKTLLLASLVDITERKQAELELRKLQEAVDESPSSIIIANEHGQVEYINPKYTETTGYTLEDVPNLETGIPPDEKEAIWQTLLVGNEWKGEFQNWRKNGSEFWEARKISPIMDAFGNVRYLVAVSEDVTNRKQVEEQLQLAHDTALEAARLKSQFLANMSHELRTPLNGIIGMANLLERTQLSDEQTEFSRIITTSAESLLSLINDILDFSKIEAGKLELEKRPFDLQARIEAAVDIVASKASSKGLEVAFIFDHRLPRTFVGDAARLQQVLVNLLSNALKFTEEGDVVVHVYPVAEGKIRFEVRDTGIGISEEQIRHLFRPFVQADASITRKYGGTGLGLTISRQLVELMGGNIWVESELGKGTSFFYDLPISNTQVDVGTKSDGSVNTKRLLILEQNESSRLALQEHCRRHSVEAIIVGSLEEVPSLLTAFDSVLVDQRLAEQFDKAHSLPNTILMKPMGNPIDEAHQYQAVLTKPVKGERFLAAAQVADEVLAEKKHEQDKQNRHLGKRHPLRILLAEDNTTNQTVAKIMMASLGYEIDIASNGQDAIRALAETPYDLILMDVQMPKMDGVTATKLIRQDYPAHQQPRIVALTAHAMSGDRERLLAAGMDDYLSKPIRLTDVQEVLERAFTAQGENTHTETKMQMAQSYNIDDLINRDVVRDLVDLAGDEGFRTLVDSMSRDAKKIVVEINKALAAEDLERVRIAAHTLKGSSGTIGASYLCLLAEDIENACLANDIREAMRLFSQVEHLWQHTFDALSAQRV